MGTPTKWNLVNVMLTKSARPGVKVPHGCAASAANLFNVSKQQVYVVWKEYKTQALNDPRFID